MEAAIRNALARVENPDANRRARIYHSAREALTRSLERQNISDANTSRAQMERLDQLIAGIEREWTAGSFAADLARQEPSMSIPGNQPVPVAGPAHTGSSADSGRRDPEFGPEPGPESGAPSTRSDADFRAPTQDSSRSPSAPRALTGEDRLTAPAPAKARPETPLKRKPSQKKKRKKRRGRSVLSALFSGLVLLIFLGIGLWFLSITGILQNMTGRNGPSESAPAHLLDPGAGFSDAWTTIYLAGQGSDAVARGQASAEIVTTGEGRALRITSKAAGDTGEVLIPVSAAALEDLAGRRSVLALTLQSPDNKSSQIYVECEFAGLGGCGRLRFNVGYALSDLVLEVDYQAKTAPGDAPGYLVLNSDVTGSGQSIDLYAIRIRAAD